MAVVSENVDAQLKPFEIVGHRLQDCTEGGHRELAAGSYGFVYEVKVDGVNRIAKKPHVYFLKKTKEAEKKKILQSFKRECVVLSKLRHPNIVQFIGVTYENNDRDSISMVMAKMERDLSKFFEDKEEISLATKLFVLQDVSFGLVYLHESNPPILHRDLTARNILLTRSLRAKIADVGVAKLMDPATMAATSHTTAPGQANYMPPEALKERAKYTLKLDSFSFGHLSLHTMLEDFPKVYTITVTPTIAKQGIIEKLRRKNSLDCIGVDHIMSPLIIQCLHDNPDKRPTARELNDRINVLVDSGSYLSAAEEGETTRLVKENNQLTEELQSLRHQLHDSESLSKELKINLDHLSVKKSKTEDNLSQLQKEMVHIKAEYESDKKNLQENVHKALVDFAIAQSEKERVLKEFDEKYKKYEEEKGTLVSIQNGLKAKCQELQQQFTKERQTWTKKQQTYELMLRTMKTQLHGEKLEAEEYSSEIAKLSRQLNFKDQSLARCEQELQYANDQIEHSKDQLQKFAAEEGDNTRLLKENDCLTEELELLRNELHIQTECSKIVCELQELQQQVTKERQTWTKKQQTYELLQRTMMTQLDGEKLEAAEIEKVSRELSFKDQTLARCEQERQYANDQLQHQFQMTELKLAQTESEMKDKQINNVTLKRELEQLHSGKMKEFDHDNAYQRLLLERDEIEGQRKEYELKYGNLMDAYSKLCQLALDHNLKVPKKKEQARYPSPRSQGDMNVREFDPAEYNLPLSQHDSGLVQSLSKRAATGFVSGRGPPGNQQPKLYADPHPGSQSPYSRNRPGIHSPANVRHHKESTTENELIVGIDHDISEAAAHMEGRAIETSLMSMDDARPLDSNLICPLCGKQFRIGQIQNYRQHVDNCSK